MKPRKLRILTFSTLYPSGVRPGHGIFVETRLRHLLSSAEVEARVVAPVPWFFSTNPRFRTYAQMAATPRYEQRNDIQVWHPRYLLPPKIGMNIAPFTLARAALPTGRMIQKEKFDFDLIDAHYFYPDGVAATIIGKALNKPVVITARGTDINLIPQYERPRRMILQAAENCAGIIAVSAALKGAIVNLGGIAEKITVLRNGVDLQLFRPEDRATARAALGASRFALASVGNLIPSKGHDLAIRALTEMPDTELYVAGAGSGDQELRALARKTGVSERVHFLGLVAQERLRSLYSAVDLLVLASEREGWPNVLLEAMACGTPVIASNVGGVPEIVASDAVGFLLEERSAGGIVRAVGELRRCALDRAEVRAYAEKFSWHETTYGQLAVFEAALKGSAKGVVLD